eukprot:424823_1
MTKIKPLDLIFTIWMINATIVCSVDCFGIEGIRSKGPCFDKNGYNICDNPAFVCDFDTNSCCSRWTHSEARTVCTNGQASLGLCVDGKCPPGYSCDANSVCCKT